MANDDITRAGTAILGNLGLFNNSAIFFEATVDPAIRREVCDLVTSWLEDCDWKGETDITDSFDELWVAPPNWLAEGDDWLAWFSFGKRSDESASYEVADLFSVGDTDYGFRFKVGHAWFGGQRKWNEFAKTLNDEIQKLAELGWVHLGKGVFFLTVPLRADPLAAAWETEDWTEALAPLGKALDALVAAQPIFDNIIVRAKPKPE